MHTGERRISGANEHHRNFDDARWPRQQNGPEDMSSQVGFLDEDDDDDDVEVTDDSSADELYIWLLNETNEMHGICIS